MTPMIRTLMTSAALSLAAGFAVADNPMVGGAAMSDTKTIVENAANSADHTTLVAAVQAAGLVETLSGPGPFTVFAPTNDAFARLPAGLVYTLLKPENKDELTRILACHVVAADAMSDAIRGMIAADNGKHPIMMVGGCEYIASTAARKIIIEESMGNLAAVTIADVKQSNGVIHVINRVLLPWR